MHLFKKIDNITEVNCSINGVNEFCTIGMSSEEVLEGYMYVPPSESFYWLKDAKKLRVYRIMPENMDPLISDFSILGFRKVSPSYNRGKKVRAEYKCINKDEIIVEKIFKDIRDDNGILTSLEIQFNWYCEDGTIGLTKTESVKSYNRFEAETEERKRRYRQFDYLRASAKGTPNEPYISMIINHYSIQINKYQDDGLLDLDVSMVQEADPTISAILSEPVPRNDGQGNTTVMRAIQYQIGTIAIEDL